MSTNITAALALVLASLTMAASPIVQAHEGSKGAKAFHHIDRNNDGFIGPHEAHRAGHAYRRADLNDDGRITCRARWRSRGPSTPS